MRQRSLHRLRNRILITTGALIVVVIISLSGLWFFYPRHTSIAAIDSANIITDPAWFKKAHDAGYDLYILHSTEWGTCTPWSRAQVQAQMALDAGMMIAAYTRDPTCWQNGINALGPLKGKLQFFALDIETDPGIPVTRAMVNGVKAMNVRPIIYTGSSMWAGVMHSSTDFADVPLWEASPTSDQTIDYLKPDPFVYGGWNTKENERVGAQQRLEYVLNGINVDISSFNKNFLH